VIAEGSQGCRIGDRPLSLDGHSGQVYEGKLDVIVERLSEYLKEVERWRAHRGRYGRPLEASR
jgi:hypothetical protein